MIEPGGNPAAIPWYRIPVVPSLLRVRSAAWLPVLALLFGLAALIYLVQTSSVATTGYDIQRLERERSAWRLRNEQLQLELAKLGSLAWIEHEATTRLGMVRPDRVVYLDGEAPLRAEQPAPSPVEPSAPDGPFDAVARSVAPWLLPGR